MKNFKRIAAFLSALTLMGSMTACKTDQPAETTPTETTPTTAPKELSDEEKEIVNQIDAGAEEKLANPTVRWLSWYSINPENNKPKMPALEMFETQYGGKIEDIPTTFDEFHDKLSTLLVGGDAPDIAPAQEGDTYPIRCINGMFIPWDEYLDFNDSSLFSEGLKGLCDIHMLGGKHYLVATGTDSRCIMVYNKNTIEANSLEDPAKLLEEDNWTWDTFREMCLDYCDRDLDQFAYDSWYFEQNFLLTTGVAPITAENGLLKNNFLSAEIERAENFMYDLKKDDLPLPKAEFDWTEQPQRISEGKTLFYPIGTWSLWEADLSKYGQKGEIMFVPLPRDPKADNYYLPTQMDAYVLCKGAKNPEGAAAYMKCMLIAGNSDAAHEITVKQYREDYGWTDEMVDMWYKVKELTNAHPIINIYNGLDSNIAASFDDALKQTSYSGKEWSETTRELGTGVQKAVDEVNSTITANYPQ